MVVVGGGFGGVQAVRKLRRAAVDITLVDRRNFSLFQPLVYQVATGALSPGEIASPLVGDWDVPEFPDLFRGGRAFSAGVTTEREGDGRWIAEQLTPGGRFGMGDVVVSDDEVSDPAPLDPSVDFPDRVGDLLEWLRQAELQPSVRWSRGDLAVISADLRT